MSLYRYIGLRICFPSTDSDHAECYPEFTYGSCHIAVAATDANWRWWWWWCCCVEEHWSASFRDMESGSAHTVYIIRHLAAWRSVLASAIERQHARCRDERSVNELHRNEVQNLMRMCRCDLQDFKLWGLKPKAGASGAVLRWGRGEGAQAPKCWPPPIFWFQQQKYALLKYKCKKLLFYNNV